MSMDREREEIHALSTETHTQNMGDKTTTHRLKMYIIR